MKARRSAPLLVRYLRAVGQRVVVEPVREGRPQPAMWLPSLQVVGVTVVVVEAALLLAALGSGLLRRGPLLVADAELQVPVLAAPLLAGALVLVLGLVVAASVHASWWLWSATTVVLILITLVSAGTGWPALAAGLAALLLVSVWRLVRRRRGWVWADLGVGLLGGGLLILVPLLTAFSTVGGRDLRVLTLDQLMGLLLVFAVPAALVAGYLGVELAVTTGTWAAELLPRRPHWLLIIVGALALWRTGDAVWRVVASPAEAYQGDALVAAGIVVAGSLALVWLLPAARRAAVEAVPDRAPDGFRSVVWPVAIGVTLQTVPGLLVVGVISVGTVLGAGWDLAASTEWTQSRLLTSLWRAAVALLVLLWLLGRRRAPLAVAAAAVVLGLAVFEPVNALLGFPLAVTWWPDGISLWCTAAGLVVLVVQAARRRLGSATLVSLAVVFLVTGVHSGRALLADPVSALLGVAGLALPVIGVVWGQLTDAAYTRHGTPGLPQPTRILLFWANGLFLLLAVAWVALLRYSGGVQDISGFSLGGDTRIGTALLLLTVLLALRVALTGDTELPARVPPADGGATQAGSRVPVISSATAHSERANPGWDAER